MTSHRREKAEEIFETKSQPQGAPTVTTSSAETSKLDQFGGRRKSSSMPQAGSIVEGKFRYELQEACGAGGFGSVWRAACLSDDPDAPPARVAIKFFQIPAGHDASKHIRRELAALLSFREPHIPPVYDWQISGDACFFVMEHYSNGTLSQVFDMTGALGQEAAWRLFEDLLEALAAAHRAGILHLDIKPTNIMLNEDQEYVLSDFGISQAIQVTDESARTVGLGTAGYQAPEQECCELSRLDTRTDLFGVGATMWALLTGIDLSDHLDMIDYRVKNDEPVLQPVSKFRPDVDKRLESLVMRLLKSHPSERPGGAAEILAKVQVSTGKLSSETQPTEDFKRPGNLEEVNAVVRDLMDPLWVAVFRNPVLSRYFVRFDDGDYLCREDEHSHHTFVLLKGKVEVLRKGSKLAEEGREGTFIGDIATLTGTPRTASVRAKGKVWACVFNAAELEKLMAFNPAIAIRLVKLMADRLIRESTREK